MFLVLEGADGSGKSTQVARVATRLRARGREVIETFEPGATELGSRLRDLVLEPGRTLDPITEALVMAADRAHHVATVVRPALARGAVVITDRFVPSSLAYQGVVRGVGVAEVAALNRLATAGLEPDLVIVLDVANAMMRARRGGADRMESEDDDFHEHVRRAYLELAADRNWIVVDAHGDIDTVTERILGALDDAEPDEEV